jgi:ATP-dependent Lon protease
LAAHRHGLFEVVLPKDNERDLVDIPENVRQEMKMHFVSSMDEVLKIALERDIVALSVAPAATAADLSIRQGEENITH